jgi:acetoin utilization deacetylase AcuC-like enzyme
MQIFTDSRCLEHQAPPGYPETPSRLAGILGRLRRDQEVIEAGIHAVSEQAILAVHSGGYLRRLERAVERGDGLFDSADNPLSAGTLRAALGAVAATLHATDRAATGHAAFAAVRPPGHHAERETAMGFCFFNNAAIAAEHLLAAHGLARVAVVDFDVHHGNGTQHHFAARGEVFFASLHQWPFYPGTGAAHEVGEGAGHGTTLNLPLPARTADAGYLAVFEETLLPAISAFAPQALVISAGFDAWRGDPLGGMSLSEEAFRQFGRLLGGWAQSHAGGRLVAVLEGGYDLEALPELVVAFLEGVG